MRLVATFAFFPEYWLQTLCRSGVCGGAGFVSGFTLGMGEQVALCKCQGKKLSVITRLFGINYCFRGCGVLALVRSHQHVKNKHEAKTFPEEADHFLLLGNCVSWLLVESSMISVYMINSAFPGLWFVCPFDFFKTHCLSISFIYGIYNVYKVMFLWWQGFWSFSWRFRFLELWMSLNWKVSYSHMYIALA